MSDMGGIVIRLNLDKAKCLTDFAEMLGSLNVAQIIGCDFDGKEVDDICNVIIDIIAQIHGEPIDSHVKNGKWISEANQ